MRTIFLNSVFLGALLLTGCSSEKSEFLALCEDAIKLELRSPSGYKQISQKFEKKAVSKDEYLRKIYAAGGNDSKKKLSESQKEALEQGLLKPFEFEAFIEYDAPNAYGTAVRERALCTHLSMTGNLKYVSAHSVKINGKSSTDRISDFARSLSNNTSSTSKSH